MLDRVLDKVNDSVRLELRAAAEAKITCMSKEMNLKHAWKQRSRILYIFYNVKNNKWFIKTVYVNITNKSLIFITVEAGS